MAQPEFPIGFLKRVCPRVQDVYWARSMQDIGPLNITREDLDCAECSITINCGWMRCESCELSFAPDSSVSILYRKQIEDYYEAANKEEQTDDVSQQAQERQEGNSSAELAASIGEALREQSYLWSWAVIPYNHTACVEGQEGGKAMTEEKLTDLDMIEKHVSACEACARRKQQTFATLEGEHVSLASKEELLARLKLVVEGRPLYYGWATGFDKLIDLTDLTKEQAALLYFELKEYGQIKTRRAIHGDTDADD